MNTYGWLLMGQTLLAMLVLGACGGWALWPFRRAERPFLWLAAPLTGLLALGGTLAVFYFGLRLPFQWCLWGGIGLNAGATVVSLVRGRAQLPSLWNRTVATVVIVAASLWATVSANKTAIDARGPTIAVQDGSDAFGYAIVGDWLRAHPVAERPRPNEVFEVLVHVNLYVEASRPVAFLLTAAAAEVRHTRALFSYDWLCGIVLGCAALGFAGLFATNPFTLAALAGGAAMSSWLTVSRTGFLGKTIAYPGAVLLAALFLTTVTGFTWRRAGVVTWLGFAVAFCVNPMLPALILTLVSGGYVGGVVLLFAIALWRDRATSFRTGLVRPLLTVALMYAAAALPTLVVHRMLFDGGVPTPPANWAFILPAALDLDLPPLQIVTSKTQTRLLIGCAVLLAGLMVVAVRRRDAVAIALLGATLLVPVARLAELPQVYLFHGLLYPLTLAGAAVLVAPRSGRWSAVAAAVLMVGMIGLRVPQSRAAGQRYVYAQTPATARAVISQSESDAIRAIVGSDPVDVWMAQWQDNCYVVTDFAPHGVDVRLRSPAWERSLKNWAAVGNCAPPDLLAPKSRFTILERDVAAPAETVRYTGQRYKVCEDYNAITFVGITDAQAMGVDEKWRPVCWIGNTKTALLIHNGTGRPQRVRLSTNTSAGPAHPDLDRRTLCYALGDRTGHLALPKENVAVIPLHLAPGLNRVELFVEEPATPAPTSGAVLLLSLCDWRLESTGAGSRLDQR